MSEFNPQLDLELVRDLAASPAKIWRCWTEADLLMQWFAPKPWGVDEAVIEARPGGRFYTRMVGPDGEQMPNEGCILEATPEMRLTFTDALSAGFRPKDSAFMTANITLEALGTGTRYRAVVRHATTQARTQHAEMGFEGGWGSAAAQLDALAATL